VLYPENYQAFLQLSPADVQILVNELVERPLSAETIDLWLRDWSQVAVLFQESMARLDIATSQNTADADAAHRATDFRETIWPIDHKMHSAIMARIDAHEAILPSSFLPVIAQIKKKRVLNQSEEAVTLLNQEYELINEYYTLLGAQTIEWQGQTLTDRQARGLMNETDPKMRKTIWHLLMVRREQDRGAINNIWLKLLDLRQKLAHINGFESYLDYCWHERERTSYTVEQSLALHQAILDSWTPLYTRLMQQKQTMLGLESLAPWDMQTPLSGELLRPFSTSEELLTKTSRVFHRVDPDFGADFDRLVAMGLVDIAVRSHTAPIGGLARAVGTTGVFVMLNTQGFRVDVENLIHEMGHAFSIIESCKRACHLEYGFTADFSETPSTAMEMLSLPYWDEFYQGDDLARARREYFEESLNDSIDCVIMEAFQIWAYRQPEEAQDVARCDAKWFELNQLYWPQVDYEPVSDFVAIGWQRSSLVFTQPLMAMEYVYGRFAGLSLLRHGDSVTRMDHYKRAVGLGCSVDAAETFAVLGTHFFFTPEDAAVAAKQLEGYLFSDPLSI